MAPLRRLLEVAPVGLIPLAWGYTIAVHLGWASLTSLQIAHGVMIAFMLTFVLVGWQTMAVGALAVWRGVIGIGVVVTAAGLAGLVWDTAVLQAVSLYGWMLLPAGALVYTGRQPSLPTGVYLGGGVLSLLGAVVYAVVPPVSIDPQVAGLTVVGIGQTVGIVDAVRR